MARKNCSRHSSMSPLSKARAAAAYCTSACACFSAFSMASRSLNRWAKFTISGRTKMSAAVDRLIQLDAVERGAAAQRHVGLSAGKRAAGEVDDYPAEGEPLTFMYGDGPCQADGVLGEAAQVLPLLSPFSFRCRCSGCCATTPVSRHIPCRRR